MYTMSKDIKAEVESDHFLRSNNKELDGFYLRM